MLFPKPIIMAYQNKQKSENKNKNGYSSIVQGSAEDDYFENEDNKLIKEIVKKYFFNKNLNKNNKKRKMKFQ